jgi:ferredoxin
MQRKIIPNEAEYMGGIPVIELCECRNCEVCIATSPKIFHRNSSGDYVEVVDMKKYPKSSVNEAIKNCPLDCISWET